MKVLREQFYIQTLTLLAILACGGGGGGGDEGDKSAPEGASLSVEAVTDSSIVIRIKDATDNSTATEELKYALYYSEEELPEDRKKLESDAVPSGGWSVNDSLRSIVGLPTATSFNVTALVKDSSSNIAKLNVVKASTGSPPNLPLDPTLSANVSGDSVTISWAKATSDTSSDSSLRYRLYTSTQANLYTAEDVLSNGSPAGDWQTNISSISLSSLGSSKRIHYNLLVKDNNDSTVAYLADSFDTDAIIHISYFDNTTRQVKYVNKLTTLWSAPLVISASDSSYRYGNGLALNSAGYAYVCYYDENNADLKLSYFDGTQFNVESVAAVGTTGQYCSISFNDSDDLFMTAYDGTARNPIFFFKFQGIWSEQSIDSISDIDGYFTDFEIDAQGKNHVAYYNSSTRDLVYATNKSGSWVVEVVDSSGTVGYYPSLEVHPDQSVSIAYQDYSNYDLKVADNNSGSWVLQTLDSSGSTGYTPSMKLGPDGLLNIAYYSSTGSQLRYLKETSPGVWGAYEVVDGWVESTGNYGLSLGVDKLDRLHISYFNDSTDNLVYAYRKDPSLVWEITEIDQDSNTVGRYSNMVVR